MVIISIKDHFGKGIGSREGGQRLRLFLEDNWDKTDIFQINFDNLKIASVSFFDETFGKLVFKHTPKELKSKMELKNLNIDDRELLNSVISDRVKESKSGT